MSRIGKLHKQRWSWALCAPYSGASDAALGPQALARSGVPSRSRPAQTPVTEGPDQPHGVHVPDSTWLALDDWLASPKLVQYETESEMGDATSQSSVVWRSKHDVAGHVPASSFSRHTCTSGRQAEGCLHPCVCSRIQAWWPMQTIWTGKVSGQQPPDAWLDLVAAQRSTYSPLTSAKPAHHSLTRNVNLPRRFQSRPSRPSTHFWARMSPTAFRTAAVTLFVSTCGSASNEVCCTLALSRPVSLQGVISAGGEEQHIAEVED